MMETYKIMDSTYRMLDAPHRAAVVLLVTGDRCVWLAQRSDTCAVMPNQWECPAGKLEAGEGYEAGALRELKEETGLVVEQKRLVPCGLTRTRGPGAMNVACALFILQLDPNEQPQNTEPHKRKPWLAFDLRGAQLMDSTLGTKILLGILVEDLVLEKISIFDKYFNVVEALMEIEDKVRPEKRCSICAGDGHDYICGVCMERARIFAMVTGIRKRVMS